MLSTYEFNNFIIGMIMTAFGVMAVIGGRISGKISAKVGRKKTILIGLVCAVLAIAIFLTLGTILPALIVGIGLMGLGFMLAHSTFLTIATEFADKSRGIAMSLVAFFFMGGGGLGTALGSRIVQSSSMSTMFTVYGIGLLLLISAVIVIKKNFIIERTN